MAVSPFKTFAAGEVLTASDLNSSLSQVFDNGEDLGWPATKAKDLDGNELQLDGDADTSITADTDDRIDFRAGGVDVFRINTVTSAVNGIDFFGSATNTPPYFLAYGSDTDIDIEVRSKGAGDVVLADVGGNEILVAADVASAINEVTITNAAIGNGPSVAATGDDTNIPLTVAAKGTGRLTLGQATATDVTLAADQPLADSNSNELLKFAATGSAINEFTVTNAAIGNAPSFSATGDDTDIDLNLVPKGIGQIQVGGVALAGVMRNYISGLILSQDTDTAHDIAISAGVAMDSTNARIMRTTAVLTKQIDANWAEGDDAGGFPSGLTLSNTTWYHVFIIYKNDGTIDGGFDTSLTATNLLTDASAYTEYRRLGSVLTDGSANILAFTQVDNEFQWTDPPLDIDVTEDATANSRAISTPLGVQAMAHLNVYTQRTLDGFYGVYISSLDANDEAASTTAAPLSSSVAGMTPLTGQTHADGTYMSVMTDTSSQIRTVSTTSSTNLRIVTLGWRDFRGGN